MPFAVQCGKWIGTATRSLLRGYPQPLACLVLLWLSSTLSGAGVNFREPGNDFPT